MEEDKIIKAAHEFMARNYFKTYVAIGITYHHVPGKWDNVGRWYPNSDDRCSCCGPIIKPNGTTRPLSLLRHGRTFVHVANLYEVDVSALKRVVKKEIRKAVVCYQFQGKK